MKNEAAKFFQEYFKVHEQDMELYEDTIDCMVKFCNGEKNEQLVNFLIYLNDKGFINNYDFDYEKEAKKYLRNLTNCH